MPQFTEVSRINKQDDISPMQEFIGSLNDICYNSPPHPKFDILSSLIA